MIKNYNYQRRRLILPEYGRHIQKMVDHLCAIEDRDERNRQARSVIAVMGNINPTLRDSDIFGHKLWDHLFIMSGFNLDVDSPYPIPTAETLNPRPERMAYPQKRVSMKHYGKNIENILRTLSNIDDTEVVEETVNNIARFMRSKSYEFNHEHPNNEVIIKDIRRLSGDTVDIDEEAVGSLKSNYRNAPPSYQKSAYKNGKTNKQYRKRNL